MPQSQIEDVVQNVWLRLWIHRSALQEDYGMEGWRHWLAAVAHHEAVNLLRDLSRRRTQALDALPAVSKDRRREDSVDRAKKLRRLQWLDEQLNEKRATDRDDYRLLHRRYFGELGVEELAQAEALTSHAVDCRLNRARARLRERASRFEDEETDLV